MSGSYQRDLALAVEAVRAAARVCAAVQQRLVTAETLEKRDRSPVTVADFASQAIVCQRLLAELPSDAVVGEEDAGVLRSGSQPALLEAVVRELAAEVPGPPSAEDALRWIDRGGADASGGRYWTLDPIDGTKGFLRGDQYAVALALLEECEVVLGVLACPNLPDGQGGRGAVFTAVRGQGAQVLPLGSGTKQGRPVRVARVQRAAQARLCESVESGHSDQDRSARIAAALGIRSEPLRIDSQCKYAAVARGDASIYLRMPTRKDYEEKVWDHAAGMLVVEEAGGRVTDVEGRKLDFRRGRTLVANRGVVATCGSIHDEVLAAIAKVQEEPC